MIDKNTKLKPTYHLYYEIAVEYDFHKHILKLKQSPLVRFCCS